MGFRHIATAVQADRGERRAPVEWNHRQSVANDSGSDDTLHARAFRVEPAALPEKLAGPRIVPGEMIRAPRDDLLLAVTLDDMGCGIGIAGFLTGFVFPGGFPNLCARLGIQRHHVGIATRLHHRHHHIPAGKNRGSPLIPPQGILAVFLLQVDLPERLPFEIDTCHGSRFEIGDDDFPVGDRRGIRGASDTLPAPGSALAEGFTPEFLALGIEGQQAVVIADRAGDEELVAPHDRGRAAAAREIGFPEQFSRQIDRRQFSGCSAIAAFTAP